MKRTTLLIDEKQLAEGMRLSRERSVSDLLRKALAEYIRRMKARQILDYLGSGVWEGDLSQMRGDAPRRRSVVPPPVPPRRSGKRRPR